MNKIKIEKNDVKTWIMDIIMIIVGGCIWATSINAFTSPNNFAPGGIVGISIVLNYLTGLPIGVMTIVITIPLLIFAIKKISLKFAIKTTLAVIITSILTDVFALFIPPYTDNPLLAAICAGAISGSGLGIIFRRGLSTGGTSLISRLTHDHIPFFSYAQLILFYDLVVITFATIVYKNWLSAVYAGISMVISEKIEDMLISGVRSGKLVFIVSDNTDPLYEGISEKMHRSATFLHGAGGYSKENKEVIMLVIKKYQLPRLKKLVLEIDPSAFIVVGEANEITGSNFIKQKID